MVRDRGRQGPDRTIVIALLASVLGLQSADLATVGASGAQLESAFGIGHLQLGLLASVTSLLSAFGTLPFGLIADRAPRVRALAVSVGLWGITMIAAGMAGSYGFLVVTRVFLGLMIAAAGPLLASLLGDLFPGEERAAVYGGVLSGELVGFGIGFPVSGNVAGLLSCRWAFWVLALPAAVLAVLLPRMLPEPPRGRQSRLSPADDRPGTNGDDAPEDSLPDLLDTGDGGGLRPAFQAVLRLRTNLVLIAVSATFYFYFGGLETFGVIFVRRQYSLGQTAATSALAVLGIGALVGVLGGGQLADRLLRRGMSDARIMIAAVGFLMAVAIVFPPFLGAWSLPVALPLFAAGSAALSTADPALDAARLDVMPASLWGRGEALRTALRGLALATAPLAFAALAGAIGEGKGEGLRLTFLAMLAPVAAAGIVLILTRRSYRRDVDAVARAGPGSRSKTA
jgi:predicted MFS family arabinose efflux permease